MKKKKGGSLGGTVKRGGKKGVYFQRFQKKNKRVNKGGDVFRF